jgi:hypothetical protein
MMYGEINDKLDALRGLIEKKPPLGSGERFKQLTKKLAKRGAEDPKALAAWIGRKKYGKKKFQALAAKGEAKQPTFQAAKQAVMDYLKSKGWKMSGPLKVPYATSPDGMVRLWFKSQAVWFSYGNAHNLGGARSVHSDIRAMTPEEFVVDAEKFARRTQSESTSKRVKAMLRRKHEVDVGQLYGPGRASFEPTTEKSRGGS